MYCQLHIFISIVSCCRKPLFYRYIKYWECLLKYWKKDFLTSTCERVKQKIKQFSLWYKVCIRAPWQHTLNWSWVPTNAHDCSGVSFNKLKKWSPCRNLQISQSRFHQLIKKWIFLNHTRKVQLKNVQNWISTPLGSLEIQKTIAVTVLQDIL